MHPETAESSIALKRLLILAYLTEATMMMDTESPDSFVEYIDMQQ